MRDALRHRRGSCCAQRHPQSARRASFGAFRRHLRARYRLPYWRSYLCCRSTLMLGTQRRVGRGEGPRGRRLSTTCEWVLIEPWEPAAHTGKNTGDAGAEPSNIPARARSKPRQRFPEGPRHLGRKAGGRRQWPGWDPRTRKGPRIRSGAVTNPRSAKLPVGWWSQAATHQAAQTCRCHRRRPRARKGPGPPRGTAARARRTRSPAKPNQASGSGR